MQNNVFKKIHLLVVVLLFLTISPFTVLASNTSDVPENLPTTGFEDRDETTWTTLEEEEEFIQEIAEMSDRVRVTQEGTSVEGRPIHLIRVGNPLLSDEEIANGRSIYIAGTPHGNEPAGREMTLKLLRDLAFTNDENMVEMLNKSTVLIVPTPNPDGRAANIRRNAMDIDNNRDNLNFDTPENQVTSGVLNYFKPDIIVDAHERGGTDPGIEFLWPRNLNVDEQLRDLNQEMVEDHIMPDVEADGFTTGYYGSPGGAGGGDERILRNVGGLRHSLSLLTESGRGYEPAERVAMQTSSVESVLAFYQERFDEITEIVDGASERRAADGKNPEIPFYLDGADNWSPTKVLDKKPQGYLMTASQADEVSKHIDLFSIETENVNNGVFVTMHQPMMTVVPFLLDARASYNEVDALPLYNSSNPGSAANIKMQIEHFEAEDAFENAMASRTLNMHISAVDQFEKLNAADKVIKHMETFKLILNQQKESGFISDEAFNNLTTYATFVIDKWENDTNHAFDSARAMDHLNYLSVELGERVAGSDEEKAAAAYIKEEFERLGYTVSKQSFDTRNGESENVIAVKEGASDNADIVYLTAHYDSVPGSPGANDNGSGTSTMLELARVLKDVPSDKEIRFVAFGAEEIGLIGSRYYVGELSEDEVERSVANFNMDMVGTAWERATQLYVNVVDGAPNQVWQSAEAAAEKLGNDDIFLYKRGASDHVPFYDAGIDSANFIWREPGTAQLEPWYHTPEDTIDHISPERIQIVGDLIQTAVSDLVQ